MKNILFIFNRLGYFFGSKIVIIFIEKIKLCLSAFSSSFHSKHFKYSGKNILITTPFRIIGHKYISIGENFNSLYGLRIEIFDKYYHQVFFPKLVIGDNVIFNTDCHIACINEIVIGNNVLIASRVFITDHNHGKIDTFDLQVPAAKRDLISTGSVVIEDNVWIGEGVSIMPNVTVGKNSIIGANSVVTKSFPANVLIAGVPAKIIKNFNPAPST